eukprot:TRINITY_DN2247_c0_g1_i1.p1 TRINITY_DN2247_c0_g1~~TRINITY_DN2247_c0_g1_i1.p1  ORF type:complete len:377 (-),score=111.98 TRINITY_DN2247_c0_g1_i1:49-1179(-)
MKSMLKEPSPYARLVKTMHPIRYLEDEYDAFVMGMDPSWTKEETNCLFDLCDRFDLRFPIIADRFGIQFPHQHRSIPELQNRYVTVCQSLLRARAARRGASATAALAKHPIMRLEVDVAAEMKRRDILHRFLGRTTDEIFEESWIREKRAAIEELKKRRKLRDRRERERNVKDAERAAREMTKRTMPPFTAASGTTTLSAGSVPYVDMTSDTDDVRLFCFPGLPVPRVSISLCSSMVVASNGQSDSHTAQPTSLLDANSANGPSGGDAGGSVAPFSRRECMLTSITSNHSLASRVDRYLDDLGLSIFETVPMPTVDVCKLFDELRVKIIQLSELEKKVRRKRSASSSTVKKRDRDVTDDETGDGKQQKAQKSRKTS